MTFSKCCLRSDEKGEQWRQLTGQIPERIDFRTLGCIDEPAEQRFGENAKQIRLITVNDWSIITNIVLVHCFVACSALSGNLFHWRLVPVRVQIANAFRKLWMIAGKYQ